MRNNNILPVKLSKFDWLWSFVGSSCCLSIKKLLLGHKVQSVYWGAPPQASTHLNQFCTISISDHICDFGVFAFKKNFCELCQDIVWLVNIKDIYESISQNQIPKKILPSWPGLKIILLLKIFLKWTVNLFSVHFWKNCFTNLYQFSILTFLSILKRLKRFL